MVHALRVGDTITVRNQLYDRAGSWSNQDVVRVGETRQLTVTRLFAERIIARGNILGDGSHASVYVPRGSVVTVNGEPYHATPGERRLGTPPEDTDEVTHIHLDDPGIQWLFRDMAAYAEGRSWCGDYDRLAGELGIPGRERTWTIHVERNGMTFRTDVSAPSLEIAQAKAEALFVPA